MLLSFQRPSRLCCGGDSSGLTRLGRGPSGQWSIAHPSGPSEGSGSAAARAAAGSNRPRAASRTSGSPAGDSGVARELARSDDAAGAGSAACRAAARARRAPPAARPGRRRRAARRRASRRPGPASAAPRSASGRTPRRSPPAGGPCRSAAATVASSISSGSSCAMKTRSKPASASAGVRLGVEPRHERARERALGVARAELRPAARTPSSSEYHGAISSSGIRSVLPYISSGGSVTPIALPNDFDIFCTPSSPVSSGSVSTICGAWP